MKLFIFFICEGQKDREKNDEKCCKYQLTLTKHISSFGKANAITEQWKVKSKL